jgi:hypothetical protein
VSGQGMVMPGRSRAPVPLSRLPTSAPRSGVSSPSRRPSRQAPPHQANSPTAKWTIRSLLCRIGVERPEFGILHRRIGDQVIERGIGRGSWGRRLGNGLAAGLNRCRSRRSRNRVAPCTPALLPPAPLPPRRCTLRRCRLGPSPDRDQRHPGKTAWNEQDHSTHYRREPIEAERHAAVKRGRDLPKRDHPC